MNLIRIMPAQGPQLIPRPAPDDETEEVHIMSTRARITFAVVGLIVASCGGGGDTDDTTATTDDTNAIETTTTTLASTTEVLTLMSHDSFAGGVTDDTFAPFTESTGIEVRVLPAGDAGSMVNQAILTVDKPVRLDDSFLCLRSRDLRAARVPTAQRRPG